MWSFFESDVVEPFRRLMHATYGDGWVLLAPLPVRRMYDELIRRRERLIFMPATTLPSAGLRVRHGKPG